MSARRLTIAALALVLPLVSGCSLVDSVTGRSATRTPAPVLPVPKGAETLATFYTQRLSFTSCGGAECADLTVPVDYDAPEGATIAVKVLRVPAKSQRKRIGSLVVNPGGPGGSGTSYAQAADFIVGADVREVYDVVGFDPRGVGDSAPINCLTDAELDAFLGSDPSPDDAADRTAYAATSERLAQKCAANAGPLLAHVSTRDAARDMDILRAALGEEKLTYLGKSYGTYLGTVYADLFPQRVGRFVLDGAIAPDLTTEQINAGQAAGFERATRAWAQGCLDDGGCPFGSTVDEVVQTIRDFLADLDSGKITVTTGDTAVPRLTEGWASYGIAAAMYDVGMWSTLVDALSAALGGDGSELMDLANRYADRLPGGRYDGNIMEVIYAVNCLDLPDSASIPEHIAAQQRATAKAPTWAPFLMWSSMPCGFWPHKGTGDRSPIAAEGAAPIVVVGTTRDPATPYEWAVQLRKQLSSGVLVTYDGDGHTAYMSGSSGCVDTAIDAYYIQGTVPKDGLTC